MRQLKKGMTKQQQVLPIPTWNRAARGQSRISGAWAAAHLLVVCLSGSVHAADPVVVSPPVTATSTVTSTATTNAEADGGVVSYQGRLTDAGVPASGSFDFRFLLKDAAVSGNTVGEPLSMTLQVKNGVFSASLPWKSASFDGASRWVEVQVRPTPATGSNTGAEGGYAVLERQRIFSTPYSYRSLSAATVESVPVASLPASVPLKGTDGKLDSGLLADDIARSSQLSELADSVKALEDRLTALSAENTSLKQSVQVLSAPARSGWMAASSQPNDASLIASGFRVVTSIPAPVWTGVQTPSYLTARYGASGVWTGQEWIIWGGKISNRDVVASGARYRPDLDRWMPTSLVDAPVARSGHTAVWTGTEMIIWGGFAQTLLSSGARYHLGLQRWMPVANTASISARSGHSAVWSGSGMVVFGGRSVYGPLGNGALYDPVTDRWSTLPTQGAPTARSGATALWTGSAVLIWGGDEVSPSGTVSPVGTGALLTFSRDGKPEAWKPMSTTLAPRQRHGHASAWDGRRLFIWGGRLRSSGSLLNDGAVWDSVTDTWSPIGTKGAPTPCYDAVSAWTGEEFVVLSGGGPQGPLSTGAAWNPVTATWRPLPSLDGDSGRQGSLSAWTGSHWLIFGGQSTAGAPIDRTLRLEVRTPWYFYRRSALPTETLPPTSP